MKQKIQFRDRISKTPILDGREPMKLNLNSSQLNEVEEKSFLNQDSMNSSIRSDYSKNEIGNKSPFNLRKSTNRDQKPGTHQEVNIFEKFLPKKETHRKINFIPSETELLCEKAIFKSDEYELAGFIVITEFRMIFIMEEKSSSHEDLFSIPLLILLKVEKSMDKKHNGNYTLEITTKDNRNFKFYICKDELQKIFFKLSIFVAPKDLSLYSKFAKKYKQNHESFNDGWKIYNHKDEFIRQGIKFNEFCQFRIVDNSKYQICETYPEIIVLPRQFSDHELNESKNFRTKNRVPALSWYNKKTKATIWRSSQTKSGITQQRCQHDESLLREIAKLGIEKLIIFDARPYLNALANRLKGAGFENTDNYFNAEIHFCQIDHIHSVRNSLSKLHQLCRDIKINENRKFFSNLEQTGWYEFIHLILKSAVEISNKLREKNSVLIHCSDGWDRTSQLTSLSEMLIDPYYRTLRGFIVLIEKDWISFGHQFALRSGFYEVIEDQKAPIFLQFLDCVHQLLIQFPTAFEFNIELLLFLAYHHISCKYGTFIFNYEKERKEKKGELTTVSIWTDVLDNLDIYMNPFYKEGFVTVLYPNTSPYKLRFWEEYFLRFNFSHIKNCKRINIGYNSIHKNKSYLKSK